MFLSLDIHSILYRISVFNSIAIIVSGVIICSLHQCTVYYIWGSAKILKTLLVLSMDLIAFMLFSTAANGCKLIPYLKWIYNSILVMQKLIYYTMKRSFAPQNLTETSAKGILRNPNNNP